MMDLIKKIIEKALNRETITYIIFGLLTTVISIVVYTLCINAEMSVTLSNTISTVIAVTFAFITNKIWVFESKDMSIKTTALEFVKFAAGRAVTYVVETALLILLVDIMMFNPHICKYFTQVVIIVLNYVISKFAVFKDK